MEKVVAHLDCPLLDIGATGVYRVLAGAKNGAIGRKVAAD